MGLDVYAVRPGDPGVTSHATLKKPVTFSWLAPEALDAFEAVGRNYPDGLMWPSDGDVTGFRGAVYQEWVHKTFGLSLYELTDSGEVSELADQLDGWLTTSRASGTAVVQLDEGSTTPLSGIEALARFLRAAADQKLWLYPDY